jgi:hypothetical protein
LRGGERKRKRMRCVFSLNVSGRDGMMMMRMVMMRMMRMKSDDFLLYSNPATATVTSHNYF